MPQSSAMLGKMLRLAPLSTTLVVLKFQFVHRRSTSLSTLAVRCTRLSTLMVIGYRDFPVAAAHLWNSLPQHVTLAPSLSSFCRLLRRISLGAAFLTSHVVPACSDAIHNRPRSGNLLGLRRQHALTRLTTCFSVLRNLAAAAYHSSLVVPLGLPVSHSCAGAD